MVARRNARFPRGTLAFLFHCARGFLKQLLFPLSPASTLHRRDPFPPWNKLVINFCELLGSRRAATGIRATGALSFPVLVAFLPAIAMDSKPRFALSSVHAARTSFRRVITTKWQIVVPDARFKRSSQATIFNVTFRFSSDRIKLSTLGKTCRFS